MRYLEFLATAFLIKPVPAWSSGQGGQGRRYLKLAVVESGIACHLIGQDEVLEGAREQSLGDAYLNLCRLGG